MKNNTIKRSIAVLAAAVLPVLLHAQPSAHYVPGVEGLQAASLPPPGLYLRDYTVVYTADRMNNSSGNEISGMGASATIVANVPRVLWVTDTTLLGGKLGVDALLPVESTELSVKAAKFDDRTIGIGDLCVGSTISWHGPQFDSAIGYAIWAPTGNSAAGLNTDAGEGFWTHMFTAGATWYFDTDKTWNISLLDRYEISTKQRNEDLTPGDTDTLEWGLGYAATKTVNVGLAGYFQGQVTRSTGAAASPNRSSVIAVGPEVSGFCPSEKLFWSLRWLPEVEAKSRLQGETTVLTLTKIF
jgi:hypothetical protein